MAQKVEKGDCADAQILVRIKTDITFDEKLDKVAAAKAIIDGNYFDRDDYSEDVVVVEKVELKNLED